uniref:Dynamin N-terminal domain-containing protein n=1 Tax=Strigamia maritima TaxID=126957 RepID=T1J2L1_STRMM
MGSKRRSPANSIDSATVSVNERVLKECHALYTDPENGLIKIAKSLDLKLLAPRKKIFVMLIGNHSAGKSSFINWYLEEHVQRTGVAIETQGFTIVTSGKKRESLTGNASLHLFPYFKPLMEIQGVVGYLSTEISTSKQKKFSLVTFIDTPGLVDGDMKYPFDVNEAILWLGDMADLIFIFFDPIGQALCKRTLNLAEKLNDRHSDRLRFYLSKADEAGTESDRQRVMMQIVQELCKRPGLNKCGFEMPTIYIPNSNKATRCVNQIEAVCKDIEKTINHTIQNTLNSLEKDCEKISELVGEKITQDSEAHRYNLYAAFKGFLLGFLGIFIPALFLTHFLTTNISHTFLTDVLGKNGSDALRIYLAPIGFFWKIIPIDYHFAAMVALIMLSLFLLLLAKFVGKSKETLKRKQKKVLLERREFVESHVKEQKKRLYEEYLKQSVADHDL